MSVYIHKFLYCVSFSAASSCPSYTAHKFHFWRLTHKKARSKAQLPLFLYREGWTLLMIILLTYLKAVFHPKLFSCFSTPTDIDQHSTIHFDDIENKYYFSFFFRERGNFPRRKCRKSKWGGSRCERGVGHREREREQAWWRPNKLLNKSNLDFAAFAAHASYVTRERERKFSFQNNYCFGFSKLRRDIKIKPRHGSTLLPLSLRSASENEIFSYFFLFIFN